MKKKLLLVSAVLVLSLSLTGCKSTDYKDAIALEESGDYAGALEIFNTLADYKDANSHASSCQSMMDSMAAFDDAVADVTEKNTELQTLIDEASTLVSNAQPLLDESLYPALETAVSNAKAAKTEVPSMPATIEEIDAATAELNQVDYTSNIDEITGSKEAVENSMAQYALVNAPSEAYIIECLKKVEHVVDISAVTEDNDPNGKLNKAGGYTAQVYFSSDLVDQSSVFGTTVIDKGTDCGGSIEVYATAEEAENRNTYLAAFDGGMFASGSHTVIGTCIVRTSDELKASEQKELEAAIIAQLTTLE